MDEIVSRDRSGGSIARKLYQPYVAAKWGLRNHWYPAAYSHELADDGFFATTICGEPILLRREDGKVHAVEDRCVHRGVKMSIKPHCFKKGTVTCWYHGFTYGLEDGELQTIVASPDDQLIGKVAIQIFPVEEKYGIIFVFVGDKDYQPVPPLESDLPLPLSKDYPYYAANLTDENVITLGIHRTGKANWRLACENGFDPGHVLIHWKSKLVYAANRPVALGSRPLDDQALGFFEDEDGPKGVMNMTTPDEQGHLHYERIFENTELGLKAKGSGGPTYARTSMWLPGVLRVENFPMRGVNLYEWYVPITDDTYEYWEMMTFSYSSEEEKAEIIDRYENYLKEMVFYGFNDDDVWAREAMQPFYENDVGFDEEQLCEMDAVIVAWRKMVAKHARGIQPPPKELGSPRGRR